MKKYSPCRNKTDGEPDMTEDKDGYWYAGDEVNNEIYELKKEIKDLKKRLEEISDIASR